MSKLDSIMKCAKARILISEKQYKDALEIVEKIDSSKVKSISDLKTIADVYIKNEEFMNAREVYFRLYDKIQTKAVLYSLIYLSVKCKLIEEAEDFYKEYTALGKPDVNNLILKYYIEKAKGTDRSILIEYLKEIKKEEYIEEWAYELAKLYHKEGMEEKCIEECSNIILWFGEGVIVEKAMLLKLHYVDGLDISNSKSISETRNIAAELRIAAAIAERNEQEKYEREQYEKDIESEQHVDDHEEQAADFKMLEDEIIEAEDNVIFDIKIENGFNENPKIETEKSREELTSKSLKDEEIKEDKGIVDSEEGSKEKGEEEREQEKEQENKEEQEREDEREEENKEEIEQGNEEETKEEKIEDKENEDESRLDELLTNIVREAAESKEAPHFCIFGEGEERLYLVIKKLAKELCANGLLQEPRVARISAEKLNGVSLNDKREQLEGGLLLVENAHELSLSSLQELYQIIRRMKYKLTVVLADEEQQMKSTINKNRKLKSLFKYELYM